MRLLRSVLLALALSSCAPAPAAGDADPALWRITDDDSEIWLFGTVHLLPEDVQWRSARVQAAFASADEFVTEADTGPEATAEFQRLATELGTLPPGETLLAQLDAESRARFERVAQQANLDARQFETVRPWLAAMQISYFHATAQGHTQAAGVETVLAADAEAQRKRHTYLETASEQIHILADLPHADQLRFLQATLRQIEQEDAALEDMDRAWAAGDITDLGEQLDAQIGEAGPAVHEALIVRRNRAWADDIARRLDGDGTVFVAVGAAHLVGDNSVVAMLRARGIEVEGP